jgi:hypothetical protein
VDLDACPAEFVVDVVYADVRRVAVIPPNGLHHVPDTMT